VDFGIRGRRAAVAASSGGLGLASAQALAAEGARVALCGRDAARLDAAVRSITDAGGDAVGIPADVSTGAGGGRFVADAVDALGGIDILVPNAGGPPAGGFATIGLDLYGPALEQNLLSTVAMCAAAVPAMREQGWGRVVAITSVSVRQPIEGLILSNTARAGVTGFLKTLALEVARDGVTVNSVQPGSHETERLRTLHGGDLSDVARSTPVGTVGRAEDFGWVVAFLCSDPARFITGAAMPVDGGAYRGLQ
jgi:3-oxoacyl-[acyl-carrier protein] reductase